jgi:hypothetical protein
MPSKLTKEWSEYDGDYEKEVQDIRTKDGKEYANCWPNAGKWHLMSGLLGIQISDEDVTHTRLTHFED